MKVNMLQEAKKLREAGLSVIPVGENKRPTVSWAKDQKQIGSYEEPFVRASGIAIIAGEVSGGLECIDVDVKADRSKLLWDRYKKRIPEEIFEKLVVQTTKNEGYHLIYRCKEITGNKALAKRDKDVLIETRGEGGYFIVSPSRGYKVIQGNLEKIPEITVTERARLLAAATEIDESPPSKPVFDIFEKYNAEADVLELLQKHGWEVKAEKGENILLKRPGDTDSNWSAAWSEQRRVFYVYSSSTAFEHMRGYNPSQVLSILEYDGDNKAAAAYLRKLYGQNTTSQKKTTEDLYKIALSSKIDLKKTIDEPPTIISFKSLEGVNFKSSRVCTLQNFSTVHGKSKTKKTFFIGMMAAAVLSGGLIYNRIQGKRGKVVYIDTEQSEYDSQKSAQRISKMAGTEDGLYAFCLREYSYKERCEIINFIIEQSKDLSLLIIDGVADLSYSINEEKEASRVLGLLMSWTKKHNLHIINVIHQNKADNYATGFLGSSLMKKSETVISMEKVKRSINSRVECDAIRGAREFEPFEFYINENGMPEIADEMTEKTELPNEPVPF